ncbi:MAG: alpha/beta hydrolase [Actinomycetota bacterium]
MAGTTPFSASARVDLDRVSLQATVLGNRIGGPAVVFEAGAGGFGAQWCHIQPLVAAHTVTVSYDRAGLGRSEPGPSPRSPEAIGDELAALLTALEIRPPVVLVGHSLGGLLVRHFAGRRLDDVAGLVLVDASHELQMTRAGLPSWVVGATRLVNGVKAVLARWPRLGRAMAARTAADGRESLTPAQWEHYLSLAGRPAGFATMRAEAAHFDSLFGHGHSVPTHVGEVPVRIVTAGASLAGTSRRLGAMHRENQADLLRLSADATQVTVPGATHLSILLDRRHARAVADAVIDVVGQTTEPGS